MKVKAKQSNETEIKAKQSSTDFISRVKTGIGKVKQDNETKLKVKQSNE